VKNALKTSSLWLIRLRWLALCAQVFLSFLSIKYLDLEISLSFLALIFALEIVSNLYLVFLRSKRGSLDSKNIGCVLILDTFILYCLLFITGGPSNPFSIWFLLHIALSAVILTPVWTWGLAGMSSILFSLLFVWHIPSSSHSMHMHSDGSFSLHLQGMLFAFILTALILSYFVTKVSSQLRNQEKQIFELEKERLNQLRLSSLSTLAARAAHELATPLATIAIAVGELASSKQNIDDLELIKSQVKRCQQVLDQIRENSGELRGEFPKQIDISQVIQESIRTLPPKLRKQVRFEKNGERAELSLFLPEESFKFSLLALIKNALDASSSEETVAIDYKDLGSEVEVSVSDFGRGMKPEVLEKAVEPFFTTKDEDSGMGLGLFLANTFAKQNSAEFRIKSEQDVGTTAYFLFPKVQLL